MALLLHNDPEVQRQAAELLLTTVGAHIFTVLRRQLASADEAEKANALRALQTLEQHGRQRVEQRPFSGLHFETLGALRIYVGNHELTAHEWAAFNRSHAGWQKAQALLAYLFHYGQRGMTIEAALAAIWQDRATASAISRTLTAIRYVIGELGGADLAKRALISEQNRLWLSPMVCSSDAALFERAVQYAEQIEAEFDFESALPHYQHACSLYGGNYLVMVDLYDEDIEDYRQQLITTYLYLVERISEYYFSQQNIPRCIDWCLRGLRIRATDEQLVVRLLECYARQRRSADIERLYQRYRRHLGGMPDDDDEVERWMRQWRR
ncbi:hypothetical protein A6A03_19280 [Chloroflexus islandicus]|uniref:Bacterial transcriptional activator domain-containing protein n=2 Tax=Chloroflexus islandicus TaxID=1707952 RepID=A0A178M0C9_9CHLR|nr:hypothetical protein A6A03_19280 [Chloroflexus islandicus]